jgi:hypothetical protein
MKKLYYTLLMAFLLLSCKENYGMQAEDSATVVEGWIEDGQFPVVMLTKTLPITGNYQTVPLDSKEFLVRWAKVTVSDGEKSVILTGKFDSGYMPPFIYTTSWMRGEAGKTYTLEVEYENSVLTAETTIPHPVEVDSFKVEKAGTSDSLFLIKACFADDPKEKNYYQFFTRVGTKSKQFMASYLGSFDDEVLSESVEVPVYRAHTLDNDDYTPYFSQNDTVSVKFCHIDEVSFRFWDEYTKSQSLSSNMFLANFSTVPGNVKGGIGYWCGYGSTTYYLMMHDYAK